jgi:hypothetical protein
MRNQQPSGPAFEMLNAYRNLERQLLRDLRRLLAEGQTAQTRPSILEILERLLGNLTRQFALACEGGYLSEVVCEWPNWHREVEALHGANGTCFTALDELRIHVGRKPPFAPIPSHLNENLRQWIQSVMSIRGHETRLLQKAFTLDLGGEG